MKNIFKTWYNNRPCEAFFGAGHDYVELNNGRWVEEYRNTGQFIDGKPIQEKFSVLSRKCTKCDDIDKIKFKEKY